MPAQMMLVCAIHMCAALVRGIPAPLRVSYPAVFSLSLSLLLYMYALGPCSAEKEGSCLHGKKAQRGPPRGGEGGGGRGRARGGVANAQTCGVDVGFRETCRLLTCCLAPWCVFLFSFYSFHMYVWEAGGGNGWMYVRVGQGRGGADWGGVE